MATIAEQLAQLADLLDRGLLSRAQFEQQRDDLLASSGGGALHSVGSYKILGELGRGGMGVVYRGRHRLDIKAQQQGGDVAIKVLFPQFAQDPAFRQRFEQEATLGLRLEHPGIVRALDLVLDGEHLALVMEIVDGKELGQVIGTEVGPMPWGRARPIFEAIAAAVGFAHEQGVVHRDLKPANIVLGDDGSVKVLDFGIARDLGSKATQSVVGTPEYMAPEQVSAPHTVDHRADIYALGMTLYEMVAGRTPFDEATPAVLILQSKLAADPPPPTEFYPHVPDFVVEVIARALRREREERFSSCAEMVAALRAGAMPPGKRAPPPTPPKLVKGAAPGPRAATPNHRVVLVVGGLGLVVLVALWLAFRGDAQIPAPLDEPTPGVLASAPTDPPAVETVAPASPAPEPISEAPQPTPPPRDEPGEPKSGVRIENFKVVKIPEGPAQPATEAEPDNLGSADPGEPEAAPIVAADRPPPASSVAISEAKIMGTLDRSVLDRVVKQHLAQIRFCYSRELAKVPTLAGQLVVKFVIGSEGSVSSAITKTTTLNSAPVEQCINARFMRMRFPAPEGGGIVIVSYPLTFAPQ